MHLGKPGIDFKYADRPEVSAHSTAALQDRVDTLFSSMDRSLAMALFVAGAYAYVYFERTGDSTTLWWFAAMAATVLSRALTVWLYRHRRDLFGDTQSWLRVLHIGSTATALAWGAAGFLYFPVENSIAQNLTLMILTGVAAGALSTLAGDFPSYRSYVLCTLTPLILMGFYRGGSVQIMIAVIVSLLIVFLIQAGYQNASNIGLSLELRHENADLVKNLRREKERVISEAETLLGSVLASTPLALWIVDTHGKITYIKGRKFGRMDDGTLPTAGKNLIDGFQQHHPQIAYETQRALSGETFTTEIELQKTMFEVHYSPFLDETGTQQGALGVAVDISDRIEHKKELSRRTNYDQLTGLSNRTHILDQVTHAFNNAQRNGTYVALFFINLDNFKAVNDSLGHEAGDQLLKQAARRLVGAIRNNDIPARLGGDEFLVIGDNLTHPNGAELIAHKITRVFRRPFQIDQREVYATVSLGIAVYPQDGTTADQLLGSADTAMYHAKSAGKNKYRFFTRQMQETADRHMAMETELRHAFARNEMHLCYQPKFDTQTRQIRGAEALLRWHSPHLGQVSPAEFIPVAECAGLMPEIGSWILDAACQEAIQWRSLCARPLSVAVNVSPHQFRNTDLLTQVTHALITTGLTARELELEITENVLVQDAPDIIRVFDNLQNLGITLSLDDFGTGYSSLSYLKKFPLQVLKIDKSFVQDLNGRDDSLVDAIIAMAHSLDLTVVAEGVETEQQFEFLKQRKVELIQGFLLSKPVSGEEFRAMLQATASSPGQSKATGV